jgi:Carboxypeptidase regulatory-like domain
MRALLVIALTATASLISFGQSISNKIPSGYGAVEGQVIDSDGKEVVGASVYAEREGPDGILPETRTHSGGKFLLPLTPGTYVLYAVRPSQGFKDTSNWFFNGEPWAIKATVSAGQITRAGSIRLNTKMARLTAQAIDGRSGKFVKNAAIELCPAENPKRCPSTGTNVSAGGFRLLVPSLPLIIKVSARGYEDWYYGGDGSQAQAKPLQLTPHALKQLTVRLQPKTK